MNAPRTAAPVRRTRRGSLAAGSVLVASLWLLGGCKEASTTATDEPPGFAAPVWTFARCRVL